MAHLRVSSNGRYVEDDAGAPFFFLGENCWELFYKPSLDEAHEYLENRKNKGFTVIMAPFMFPQESAGLGENVENEPPLEAGEPHRPNEAFYRRAERIIDMGMEMGLVFALFPTWGKFVGPLNRAPGPILFDRHGARTYAEYLGNRFGPRGVVWVLGGDRNPEEPYLNVWRAMADGLRRADGGSNPITYHPQTVHSTAEFIHDEAWLDFNMIQSGTDLRADNAALVLRDYDRDPTKPVLNGETRYEHSHEVFFGRPAYGRRMNAHDVRKAAYECMLSGAMGHAYGCRDVWRFYDPAHGPSPIDVTVHWRAAMDFDGAFDMGRLRKLFTDYPWHQLVPDRDRRVVIHGCHRGETYTPAAVSADHSYALVYVPENQPVVVDTGVLGSSRVRIAWFNPRTGDYHHFHRYGDGAHVELRPPHDSSGRDFVLVLERGDQEHAHAD